MDSQPTTEVVIPLSKGKIWLLLMGAFVCAIVSFWGWSIADTQTRHDPLYVKCIAVAGGILFAASAFYGLVKLFDNRPGLIVDEQGIVDNSSGVAAGRILWDEITGLKVFKIQQQRFLIVEVIDPAKFLERSGFFVRMLQAANAKMTGSPISISSNSLRANFDELVNLIGEAFERSKRGPG